MRKIMTDSLGKSVILAVVVTMFSIPQAAASKDCGGKVECECGDTVVVDYTMTEKLNCENYAGDYALHVKNGVRFSNAGFEIVGPMGK